VKLRVALFICAALLSACSFDHLKEPGDGGAGASSRSLNANGPLSYAQVYEAVLQPRCVGCHGGQGGVTISDNYDATLPYFARIQAAALTNKTMPKGGSLSADEARLLSAWFEQGAPRAAGQTSQGQRGVSLVTWNDIKTGVFERKCFDCHAPPKPEKDLDLTDLAVVKAKAGSILEHCLVSQDMPLAPYEKLTVEEKQTIANWIAAGFPE
jgi:uncharacterized membrane protein